MSEGGRSVFTFLTPEKVEPSRMTSYVLGTLALALLLHWIIQIGQLIRRRIKDAEALKAFPGPKGHWLWGNIVDVVRMKEGVVYSQIVMKDYPKICRTRMTPFHYNLRVYHPETVRVITNTAEPKDPFGYRFLEPWIGQGLLVSKGHRWARSRRLLTPAFNFDILKPYVTIFSKSSFTMATKLINIIKKGDDESIELFEHVSLMTFDSLMKCIFGFQGDCQIEGFTHPYVQGVYEVAKLIQRRFMYFPHYSDLLYTLSWNGFKFRRACSRIHKYSRSVIKEKKDKLHNDKEDINKEIPLDFLDMLLKAKDEDGKGLTDEEIQAEVDTFMFEGHDTTASGISWCLYNLARHPEYQAKCRDEVNSVLGGREHFTWEDVHRLPFLTMCVKESLRLHPPVPMISRETTKTLDLPDGRTIPAGTIILISVFGCHHNPDVWHEPEVFDPYRFTLENSKDRSPHAFIPFSAGPRNCIGQHFALHEMKIAVGQVLRRLELFEDKSKVPARESLLVLRAKEGLFVKFKPIDT